MQTQIDIAGPDDFEEIARLHQLCFGRGWSVEELQLSYSDNPNFWRVARHKTWLRPGMIAGFALVRGIEAEAEILSLGVHPRWRRHQIARKLMETTINDLYNHLVKRLFLEVAADNVAAIGLYRNLGFSQIGTRANYYENCGKKSHAVTMRLDIRN